MLRLWNYRSSKDQEVSALNQGEFSLARYEPMARLLSAEDLAFIQAQPGYIPEMGKKFLSERRRIFRMYLQELAQDFHRLHAQARVIAASLPAEHASLIGVLVRLQSRFWLEITFLEFRLSFGVRSIDVSELVKAVANMQSVVNARPSASMG